MADKKINELDALLDAEVAEDTRLFAIADGTTGLAKKGTVAQAKLVFSPKKVKYVSDNSEGSTLTIPELSGKTILLIARESGIIYEVESAPTSSEFTFDGTDIVLGVEVSGYDERFLILYI